GVELRLLLLYIPNDAKTIKKPDFSKNQSLIKELATASNIRKKSHRKPSPQALRKMRKLKRMDTGRS
ncbi:MAG: hypothetical protein ACI4F3_12095, partial [Enterocloster sp.]